MEDRKLLYATLGDAWAIPARITYSFAPDGTNVGGMPSNTFATLNKLGTTATWQLAFKKAAAYWSSYANINIVQVSDNGADLGGTGNQQGDPNFGDIRIAMVNQGANGVLAATFLPPKANGGTVAGDIVFNSGYTFQINADYDLQTTVMHEFGHALGLGHSDNSTSDMYPYYMGIRQSPSADDASGIQAVYGAYPTDTDTNTTVSTATNITPLMNSTGQVTVGNQNMTGATDLDWFYVTAPANTSGTMTVTMQASGLSMLNPRVAVYNSAKTGIAQASTTTNFGGNATVTITGVTAGQGFYIRASAATAPGANGAYGLLVNFGSATQNSIAPPKTAVAAAADQGGGTLSQTMLGQTITKDMAEMNVALGEFTTQRDAAVKILLTDTLQLLGILKNAGDTSSDPYKHLFALSVDLIKVDMTKAKADLNLFFGDVLQIGTLVGFGDTLDVSAANFTKHAGTDSPKPSDAPRVTVIGSPPVTGELHHHATHQSKGTRSQHPLTHQSSPLATRATWASAKHSTTAFKLKGGRS